MNDKYKGQYPKAWTDVEVDEYLASGREPDKASNGVWVSDVEREDKDLVQWTVAEMFALYNGELVSDRDPSSEGFLAALLMKAKLECPDANKWGTDELYHWLMTGKEPEKTKAGNYVNDPERFTKDVHLLNDSELVDFGCGYFGPFERDREHVLVEALDRFSLDIDTTFEDYAQYCMHRVTPPKAPNGSLINSRSRSIRLVTDWKDEELFDWAIGAIDSAGHDEAELLTAATLNVGGEWFWSKEDVAAFITDGTIADIANIDLDRLSLEALPGFIKQTGSDAAFALYLTKVDRRPMTPLEFSGSQARSAVAVQWSDEQIRAFIVEGTVPAYWKSMWETDTTREGRIPSSLTAGEIEGAYREKLVYTDAQREEILKFTADALRAHGKKPYSELYDDEALALHFDEVAPAITSEGLLVRNFYRDSLSIKEWTNDEVRALLKREIITPVVWDINTVLTDRLNKSWEGLAPFEQLVQWFVDDVIPPVTENGVYIKDPRRCTASISQWSDSELVALAHGWIEGLDNVTEESLIATLADKQLIKSADWSLKEVLAFLTDGTEPARTEFGSDAVTYDDQTINRKNDLRFFADWANGKVTLPNTKEQVLNRARTIIGANVASDSELMAYLKAYKGDGTDAFHELSLLEQLQDGTDVSRRKVIGLWNLSADTTTEEAIVIGKAFSEGELTSNGVLRIDPRRDFCGAYMWSLEELRSWARGEIPQGASSTPATLVNALRARISSIDAGWDDDSVKRFAATGEQPKRTSTGVLVVDVVRDKKYPSDWSDEDLKAWANQEVITPVPSADVMLSIRTRFNIPSRYSNTEAIRYLLTGEEPVAADELPFESVLKASDLQLQGWLRGEVQYLGTDEAGLYAEIRARFKIDVHWVDSAIVHFYKTGQHPKKTSNGLFIEDRLRDLSSIEHWSFAEMEAFAKGEFTAPTIAMKGVAFIARARNLISVEKGLPAGMWAITEIVTYLQTGERPAALAGNVFANDPKREAKAPLSWTNDELRAFLRKEIPATDKAPEQALWDLAYMRFSIPSPWYPEDARSYVLTGTKVPATPSGIWIRDRERDQRSVWTWSRAEVKAWARGLILPGLKATEEELVTHAAYCFNLPATLSPEMIKLRVAGITEDTTPMTVAFVREDLLAYAEGMKKEGGVEAKAALYQQLLYRCITRVTALRQQDFVDGWTELLKFYFDHKSTIFTPGQLYNGVAMMAISSKQQKHFQHMTTILYNTCDPAQRDAQVKRIDWSIGLAGLPNEESRHELLGYYGI
jgi:hypothetical protein